MIVGVNEFLKKARKPAISFVVIAYVISALVAASPPSYLTPLFQKHFAAPIYYLGLSNNFGMFSPNTKHSYNFYEATVKFANGGTSRWSFPTTARVRGNTFDQERMFSWAYWQGALLNVDQSTSLRLYRDAARYLAWLHRNPTNQPVRISIYRLKTDIQPPEAGLHCDLKPVRELLIDYPVESKDVQ